MCFRPLSFLPLIYPVIFKALFTHYVPEKFKLSLPNVSVPSCIINILLWRFRPISLILNDNNLPYKIIDTELCNKSEDFIH